MKKKNFAIRAIGEKEHAPEGALFSRISLFVPTKMKPLIRQRAAQLELTVSQYVRRLVNAEITTKSLKVRARKDVVTGND
jgi:hypothetical protein